MDFFNHEDDMVESKNHKTENKNFLEVRNALKDLVNIITLNYQQADWYIKIFPNQELGVDEEIIIKVQSKCISKSSGVNGGAFNIRRIKGLPYDPEEVDIILAIDNRPGREGKYVGIIPIRDRNGNYSTFKNKTLVEKSTLAFSDTNDEVLSNSKMFALDKHEDIIELIKAMIEVYNYPSVSAENRKILEEKMDLIVHRESNEFFEKLRKKAQDRWDIQQRDLHTKMIQDIGQDAWENKLKKYPHVLDRYMELFKNHALIIFVD